jgi:transposase InsO family protein
MVIKNRKVYIWGIFIAKKGSRFRKHSQEFKLEIVKSHLKNGVLVGILAKEYGVKQSMSRKGSPLDNAPVESFFGWFKDELYTDYRPKYFFITMNEHNQGLETKHPSLIGMSAHSPVFIKLST